MIYRLRRKFIAIISLSLLGVFTVLLLTISIITRIQTNSELDTLADIISENDGRFPQLEEFSPEEDRPMPPQGINQESPFTTRFFTVRFDSKGICVFTDVRSVASVTQSQAVSIAGEILNKKALRGWKGDFRYKKTVTESGTEIVFVSGAGMNETQQKFLVISALVFFGGSLIVLVLVVFLSRWAVKPTAESYEKQKQFITDANHELKTPLTLIRTNLDIMESESGANEWLSDIRDETDTMTELVNRLVTLARMDEDKTELSMEAFDLSEAVCETVSVFSSLAERENKMLTLSADTDIIYKGNETALRQLVSILMDNAVKYCDDGGTICVTLRSGKHPLLTIDNTYIAVGNTQLGRLFDRFYRADSARTAGSGFGVGLSIAKAITEKHRGSISAINLNNNSIRFQVRL